MYLETFRQMNKMLGQLDKWLDTAKAFAEKKSFDPNLFVGFRLAPDQFPFSRQVQTACDTAKLGAARLTGKEPPKHDDSEKTLDELKARVASTRAYLEGFTAKDFEGTATRTISNPRWEGKTMTGADYFMEHVVPNFYFHLSTAYAILRHSGVDVGKRDYLGQLSLKG
ncbi:MAG TPA: DUF1993 domain-containing protein [Minicystis sp.]|nr:DUF1993 domain-containing protein [Minicystis sp.]